MRQDSARGGGSPRGEVLASISTGLVRLHSRYYGKGPTKAKTYLVNDTVICILRGGFTTVERTLIDEGNVDAVYQIRRSFQQAMTEHFRKVVEGAMSRKVIAYMSQIHQDPDLAVEIFVLEPAIGGEADGYMVSGLHEQDLSDGQPSQTSDLSDGQPSQTPDLSDGQPPQTPDLSGEQPPETTL